MHIGKNQHLWVFMGKDTIRNGEYEYCDRCHKMYLLANGKRIPVSLSIYDRRKLNGQITGLL